MLFAAFKFLQSHIFPHRSIFVITYSSKFFSDILNSLFFISPYFYFSSLLICMPDSFITLYWLLLQFQPPMYSRLLYLPFIVVLHFLCILHLHLFFCIPNFSRPFTFKPACKSYLCHTEASLRSYKQEQKPSLSLPAERYRSRIFTEEVFYVSNISPLCCAGYSKSLSRESLESLCLPYRLHIWCIL